MCSITPSCQVAATSEPFSTWPFTDTSLTQVNTRECQLTQFCCKAHTPNYDYNTIGHCFVELLVIPHYCCYCCCCYYVVLCSMDTMYNVSLLLNNKMTLHLKLNNNSNISSLYWISHQNYCNPPKSVVVQCEIFTGFSFLWPHVAQSFLAQHCHLVAFLKWKWFKNASCFTHVQGVRVNQIFFHMCLWNNETRKDSDSMTNVSTRPFSFFPS